MKNPNIDELFGNLFKKPKEETNLEKAIRLANELSKKCDKIIKNENKN